jgi:hypothetical protein
MKTTAAAVAAIALLGALSACGNGSSTATGSSDKSSSQSETKAPAPKPKPLDLTGKWKEKNPSKNMTMKAVITEGTIVINWVQSGGDTMIFWDGSYKAPTDASTIYSWTSTGDTAKMGDSLLGSSDKTKDFSYSNGALTFKVTMMGTTVTATMVRE